MRVSKLIPGGLICLTAMMPLSTGATVGAANSRICFPEAAPAITDCIEGRLADFWQANGGLPVFGYPISAVREEAATDGQSHLVQYFERQRLELHPQQKAPYDVLLGRLGDDQLRQQGIAWEDLPKASPDAPDYFAETGHAIAPEFKAYWHSHGLEMGSQGTTLAESLALFGLPISEPTTTTNSSGDTVLTQYFERARLEAHTEKSAKPEVLQGRLGSEVQEQDDEDDQDDEGVPPEHPTPPTDPGHSADHPTPPVDPGQPADHPTPPVDPGHSADHPTPPVDHPTPPVDPGQSTDHPTPPVDPGHSADHPTPPVEQPTPVVDPGHSADHPTPPVDHPTPPVDHPTPPVDHPTPPVDHPTPPVEQPTPPADPGHSTDHPTPPPAPTARP